MGSRPDDHYGHENAVLRRLASVPACPIGIPVRELSDNCREEAATPGELLAKLDD